MFHIALRTSKRSNLKEDLQGREKRCGSKGMQRYVGTDCVNSPPFLNNHKALKDFHKKYSNNENTFIVTLQKSTRGLGMRVYGGRGSSKVDPFYQWIRIGNLHPSQPALESGKLTLGDVILEVNGINMLGLTNKEAVEVLHNAPEDVKLKIFRPPKCILPSISEFKVMEHSNAVIQNLPNEIMIKIFENLDLKELCRAGRVCKNWFELTRCPQFWRGIQVHISNKNWFRLIQILPSCVSYINLISEIELPSMKFITLSSCLSRKCPNLKILILQRFSFIRDYVDTFSHLPKNLRILVLNSCNFEYTFQTMKIEFENMSAFVCSIEILDLSHSRFGTSQHFYPYLKDVGCSHMPNLIGLHLAECDLSDSTYKPGNFTQKLKLLNLEQNKIGKTVFYQLRNYGINLTHLYICWTLVRDEDLSSYHAAPFPNLKLICLRGCDVTSIGIGHLILSCPSLRRVYVGNKKLNAVNDYSSCNTNIVKVLNGSRHCHHHKYSMYV